MEEEKKSLVDRDILYSLLTETPESISSIAKIYAEHVLQVDVSRMLHNDWVTLYNSIKHHLLQLVKYKGVKEEKVGRMRCFYVEK